MIYYDSHKNKFITINKKDIEVKFITNNNVTTRQLSKECELVIRFDYSELKYFKEWLSDTHDTQRVRYVSEYKRDIFISDPDNSDTKFCNCFISSMELYDFKSPYNSVVNQFEVLLKCDYYEKGGVYPELKAIYRDKKIDLILSK
jgi:hypothetical protein